MLLNSIRELKGGHYRLKISDVNDVKSSFEALLFTPTPRQSEILNTSSGVLDILGELQWNYFAGQKSIQILIKDLKHANQV